MTLKCDCASHGSASRLCSYSWAAKPTTTSSRTSYRRTFRTFQVSVQPPDHALPEQRDSHEQRLPVRSQYLPLERQLLRIAVLHGTPISNGDIRMGSVSHYPRFCIDSGSRRLCWVSTLTTGITSLTTIRLTPYRSYTRWRANRLGLPPPPLNPFAKKREDPTYRAPAPRAGGVQGWVMDKWHALQNKRTPGGSYESTAGYGGAPRGGRRGFGPLDPDEAWDARVDNEASGYYEEQELGLQDPAQGPYGGHGYAENTHIGIGGLEAGRGRSRSRQRELDDRYDEEVHGGGGGGSHLNPFSDGAEQSNMSMRSVSPRPDTDTSYHGGKRGVSAHKKKSSTDDSPLERRSMFTEDVS